MMRMGIRTLALALLCALISCSPAPSQSGKEAADKTPSSGIPAANKDKPPAFNIGDVEATLRLDAKVAEASKSPTISVEELVNMRKELDMVTVTVKPPAPSQFSITFSLKATEDFAKTPVAFRAKILRDKDVIDSFEAFVGADARKKPFERTVDVLSGLAVIPDTMLIHAQTEAILLPPDTTPESVDLRTVTGDAESVGTIPSNPVRIDFEKGAATQ